MYVPRESSCPVPLTHINITRHVRDEYVDVLDMSTFGRTDTPIQADFEGHSGPSPTCIDRALHVGLHAPDGLGHESPWSHDELRFDAASSSWHHDVRVRQLSSRSRTMVRRRMLILGTLRSCRFPSDTVQLFCMMASHVVASCANSYIAESNQSFLQKGTVSVQMKSRRAPLHEDVPKKEHCLGRF